MKKLRTDILFWAALLAVCLSVAPRAAAQTGSDGTAHTGDEHARRLRWWREARFGMFVHWGLYSGLAGTWDGKPVATRGGMEWIQQRVGADTGTYARRATPLFKPKPGFAREWARLAREAGCRYVVFTTKHHDGFALHDSKVSDFDAGSVLQRDLVREIVEALRAEGLRVGFYHSVIDWHHDQYAYNRSKLLPHPHRGKPYPNGERDHSKYVAYLHAQVDELVSNYPVDILWWDYSGLDFQGDEAWRAFDLMGLVRRKRPRVLMNNRLFRIREAGWKAQGVEGYTPQLDTRYGDFITPEQHIPPTGMPGVDWETCMTMNTTWGYSEHDHAWKSDETLIRNLVDIASKGGNYLLNIGPRGDGSVPCRERQVHARHRRVDEGQRPVRLRHHRQPVRETRLGPRHEEGHAGRHDALPARLRLARRRQALRPRAEEQGRVRGPARGRQETERGRGRGRRPRHSPRGPARQDFFNRSPEG